MLASFVLFAAFLFIWAMFGAIYAISGLFLEVICHVIVFSPRACGEAAVFLLSRNLMLLLFSAVLISMRGFKC